MRGVENDLDRHFLKFVKLFNDATKHRLAIDLFMQVLHSRLGISRIEGDWGFCNFLIEDEIHGGGHNYSRMLAVLDILYSNTSLFEESLQKYTLKEDDIERLERYDADGEGKFLYERNSEHRRKIAKTVKRRKIQSIKKHIIRKSIGF
jgi:hypothetical protein